LFAINYSVLNEFLNKAHAKCDVLTATTKVHVGCELIMYGCELIMYGCELIMYRAHNQTECTGSVAKQAPWERGVPEGMGLQSERDEQLLGLWCFCAQTLLDVKQCLRSSYLR